MPSSAMASGSNLSILEVADYYEDSERSFRLFFSNANPSLATLFPIYSHRQLEERLNARIAELDKSAAFAVLTSLEATFRIDYLVRCKKRMKDPLSRRLRSLYKKRRERVDLEDELLEIWKTEFPQCKTLISDLIGALKYRHWFAHGRYWTPKLGKQYDYFSISILARQLHTEIAFIAD